MSVVLARRPRRSVAVDASIVLSAAAGFAHAVTVQDHYFWWPAAGVCFAILGAAQLVFAGLLVRGAAGNRVVAAGIWGTVAVIMLYVVSRTVGLPMTPPVPFHGGRWVEGRAMVPDGAKHVGALDVFTLVAEVLLVVTLLGTLTSRAKVRTANRLLWVGLALWGSGFVVVF